MIAMILSPVIDPVTKEEYTEVFMTNMTDIGGLVPKWLVNTTSRSVPKIWFKTYELGCQKYMKKGKATH